MSWSGLSSSQKLFAGGLAAVAVLAMCGKLTPTATPTTAPAAAQPSGDDDMALMACMAAQREVKLKLKAPASADFPSCAWSRGEYKITANDERTRFGVQGYVDSQNGFGANIRSKFVVMLIKGPGDGSSAFRLDRIAVE